MAPGRLRKGCTRLPFGTPAPLKNPTESCLGNDKGIVGAIADFPQIGRHTTCPQLLMPLFDTQFSNCI